MLFLLALTFDIIVVVVLSLFFFSLFLGCHFILYYIWNDGDVCACVMTMNDWYESVCKLEWTIFIAATSSTMFIIIIVTAITTTYKHKRILTKWHTHHIQHLNFDLTYVPRGYTYYDKKIRIDRNPIRTALNVCKQLISKKVCNILYLIKYTALL